MNISTYYRLMMTSVVPQNVDKIIYLDCDILVRKKLTELWDTDISDVFIAGVLDTTGRYARNLVGLKRDDIYVNAGVLLVNLKMWREQKIEELFLNYLREKNGKVYFEDQGIINHVCSGKIKLISPKYNFMNTYERYSWRLLKIYRNSNLLYSEREIKDAKESPSIVHFAGYPFMRPWYEGVDVSYGDEFLEYLTTSGIPFSKIKQPTDYRKEQRISKLPDFICARLNKYSDDVLYMKKKFKNIIKLFLKKACNN